MAGVGWSSPVVAGSRIFVTSVISSAEKEPPKKGLYFGGNRNAPTDEHRWMVYAFDFETGKMLWEREVHRGVPKIARHLKNSYASETPVTDGERVYAYFGSAGLYCFDMNGKPLWSQKAPLHEMRFGWATAASPVLHQGRVYIVNDNDVDSYLSALDAKTGREIWRVKRDEKSNWATPFVWTHAKRAEIVTCGTGKVRSYDLDGKVLWELGGMSTIVIPTPFSRHGLLYITSGYVGSELRPVFAIKPGASGDISLKPGERSNQWIAWSYPQAGPYNPSPLVYGDHYAPAIEPFRVLLLSFPLMSLNYALTHQLVGWHGHRAYALLCAGALIVNVALNSVLIPSLGIVGASWATLWTEAVMTTGCVIALARTAAHPRFGAAGAGTVVG